MSIEPQRHRVSLALTSAFAIDSALKVKVIPQQQPSTSQASACNMSTAVASKTVLITGATRGIGLKLAERYAQIGWNVIGTARDLNKAEKLKALSPYKIVQLDSTDEASIVRAAKELEGEIIDLLINNAGTAVMADLGKTTKADMIQQFETNAVGPFLVTRAFVPNLKAAVAARGAATVAQISSLLGSISIGNFPGIPNAYGYRASKAALNVVNAALAVDLKSDSIAAITLNPGYVATDLTDFAEDAISTDTSVDGLISVISNTTLEGTGKFISYDGNAIPW
ncbi:hypothetical protein PybrP1_006171 [[Pythium] brassicae (nom. inval.)]|nr:hypothetical protein PybrP1_006171 [[Pythium] brassicae (nom. inval.)]